VPVSRAALALPITAPSPRITSEIVSAPGVSGSRLSISQVSVPDYRPAATSADHLLRVGERHGQPLVRHNKAENPLHHAHGAECAPAGVLCQRAPAAGGSPPMVPPSRPGWRAPAEGQRHGRAGMPTPLVVSRCSSYSAPMRQRGTARSPWLPSDGGRASHLPVTLTRFHNQSR
jgi:hypothetical protein